MDPNDPNATQAPNGLDMDAINAAVAASAGQGTPVETSYDVNNISLDNTPTTNAALEQQMQENPGMSLAGGPSVSTQDPAAPTAAVDYTAQAQAPANPADPMAAPVNPTAPAAPAPASPSQNVSIGDDDPFSSPAPEQKEEEKEEFTIDSEKEATTATAIANSAAKMQDNAMKAFNAVKPKDAKGVIIAVVVAVIIIMGIIVAIIV